MGNAANLMLTFFIDSRVLFMIPNTTLNTQGNDRVKEVCTKHKVGLDSMRSSLNGITESFFISNVTGEVRDSLVADLSAVVFEPTNMHVMRDLPTMLCINIDGLEIDTPQKLSTDGHKALSLIAKINHTVSINITRTAIGGLYVRVVGADSRVKAKLQALVENKANLEPLGVEV